jgi:hypothetical protein|tara:strand:- start:4155 stop:4346 length:192 start_codon:yes stop_codon:yes gene_type:complete
MKPSQKHIAAISAAIHMYLNHATRRSEENNKKLISPWRYALLDDMPYSHNSQIGGWTGKNRYL